MATLEDGIIRVLDANGDPVSGGFLRIYDTGTTTLSDVFTAADLVTPLDNPVEADANGRLPQIFAADGLVVDCKMLTAASVEIAGTEYTKAFAGDTSGTITRDFTSARLEISGAAGIVSIEAGDPLGDDTGGKLRAGGWNGTQADTISLDGAAVNVTGKLTENSKKLDGVVYTARTSFSGATVDITLPNDPTGCLAWEIDFWDVITSGAASLRARLAYAGGAVKTGATDYAWTQQADDGSTTGAFASRDDSDAQIVMNYALTGTAAYPMSGKIIVRTSSTGNTTVSGLVAGSGGTYPQTGHFTGFGLNTYGVASTLQLLLNAGSFTSGYYRVRPLRGMGEA